jgi:hypothetical protein
VDGLGPHRLEPLGSGTDINQALGYCQGLVHRPQETILVLPSDLYEGGNRANMLKWAAALAGLGVPAFACTPDQFPDLMAAAINRQDIARWAAARDIVTTRGANA